MSSKFLELVEENNPERGNYSIVLQTADGEVIDSVNISGTEFAWNIFSKLKASIHPEEEQESDIEKMVTTASAVLTIPDQKIGKQLMSPAARDVQMAKRNMAKGIRTATQKFIQGLS